MNTVTIRYKSKSKPVNDSYWVKPEAEQFLNAQSEFRVIQGYSALIFHGVDPKRVTAYRLQFNPDQYSVDILDIEIT